MDRRNGHHQHERRFFHNPQHYYPCFKEIP